MGEKNNLKEYGLEPPFLIATIASESNSFSFELGSNSPVGYSQYLKESESATVFLGGQYLKTSLSKNWLEYRDRTIGVAEPKNLVKWSITNPDGKVAFIKDGESWRMEASDLKLDVEAFMSHVRTVSGEIIEDFIPSPSNQLTQALQPTNKGTEKLGNFSWVDKSGSVIQLDVFKNNDKLYGRATGNHELFILKSEISEELAKTSSDFQDKRIVIFDLHLNEA